MLPWAFSIRVPINRQIVEQAPRRKSLNILEGPYRGHSMKKKSGGEEDGAVKTAAGAINVSNDLTVTASNTILDLTSNNLDVNGDVVVSSSGKIRASTATINFDESINASGGNIEFTGAGTLNLTKSFYFYLILK